MRSTIPWVVAVALVAAPGAAHAGRTFYGWLEGTEVLPERGAEIQSWISEENGKDPDNIKDSSWWLGASVGVTDQLELIFPAEFLWHVSDTTSPSFTFQRFGVEARYRFVTQDPVDAPPFAPLARLAVKRDVTTRGAVIVEAGIVGSTTTSSGSVHALVDLGIAGEITRDTKHFELRPGAGVSFKVVDDFRLGAEGFAEISLDNNGESWAAVGPNLAWTHGRFWISGAFGIGVYKIKTAPKVVWGIMF